MGKKDRFQVVYSQGAVDVMRILVDTHTGVQYLQVVNGYAGGLTPLLGADGAPVVWAPEEDDR